MKIFIGNSHLDQFRLTSLHGIIICMPGASIKGLLNPASSTQLNTKIQTYNHSDNLFILHLGQVDFEFGYYYKSSLNGTKLDKTAFIENIVKIYETYLSELKCDKIVIGLNPTVIKTNLHIYNVNFRDSMCWQNNMRQEIGEYNKYLTYEALSHIYNDTLYERNMFLMEANNCLKKMCIARNIPFLDLWPCLFNEETCTIYNKYSPAVDDHHLVPHNDLQECLLRFISTVFPGH